MKYEIFVIRLLVAIMDRLVFPERVDILRDRENQILMSNASAWASSKTLKKLLEKDAPETLTDIPRPWSEGDMQKSPLTSRALDGGGLCACEEMSEHSVVAGVCVYCNRPRQ